LLVSARRAASNFFASSGANSKERNRGFRGWALMIQASLFIRAHLRDPRISFLSCTINWAAVQAIFLTGFQDFAGLT
jgi:hypothetical protein